MENLDLFVRPPVTLEGVVPPFTRDEALLGYSYRKYKPGRGLGCWEDDYDKIPETEEWSITVDGKKCYGKMNYYKGSPFEIVAQIVQEILAMGEPKFVDNTAYKWLKENEIAVRKSLRYWHMMERVTGIKETENKIAHLQQQVRIGKILASVDAVQYLDGVVYDLTEKQRACREFGMTESEIAYAYNH